jgi:hypothetical protein
MIMGIKLYWSSVDALVASIIATAGIGLIHLAHPGLHPLAYAAGWLVMASILYQTGSELSERRRSRTQQARSSE